MIRFLSTAFAAVLTFGLAATSFADPSVTNVSPAEGTVGTQFTITGTELGTKPPLVKLKLHGDATAKTIPVKLTKPFDGTTINATVLKIQPGVYDLIVTPNHGTPITVDSAFTGRAPSIDSLSATTIAPGDHVDINGSFFGTKRGKVTIGGVTAKITLWGDGKITVVVSKKNKSGTATFDIFGKGGSQDDGASADVVAPIAGKDNMIVTFDNGGAKLASTDPQLSLAEDAGGGYVLHGAVHAGTTLRQFALFGVNETIGVPHTGPLICAYQGVLSLVPFMYSSDNNNLTTTITQRAGARITGTFSGGITKQTGTGAATYHVTGTFTLTIK